MDRTPQSATDRKGWHPIEDGEERLYHCYLRYSWCFPICYPFAVLTRDGEIVYGSEGQPAPLTQEAAAEILGRDIGPPPPTTAMGALVHHICGAARVESFQPMNVNFGLFPDAADGTRGRDRKRALSKRALQDLEHWLHGPLQRTEKRSAQQDQLLSQA